MSTRSPLKAPRWFRGPASQVPISARLVAVLKLLIGLGVAGLFYYFGWPTMSYVVAGLAVLLAVVSLASTQGNAAIEGGFARFGVWVGRGLALLILTPIFFTFFPVVRILDRLRGIDPLRLRQSDAPSFWLPADPDHRRTRWAKTTFATESLPKGRRVIVPLLVLLVLGLGVGEGVLRGLGYGTPVLYLDDVEIGYWPAPNQDLLRRGNHIRTNEYGMRAPSFPAAKPKDTFRILMLGDSTLYGGSYVGQDALYARRVQAELSRVVPGRTVEVLNMGVNGWGPFHKLGYLRRFGTFEADLTLVCLPHGDPRRPLSRLAAVPYFSANSPPSTAMEEVINHLLWRRRNTAIGPPSPEEREARIERGRKAYRALADGLAARKSEVMVEILPSRSAATTEKAGAYERGEVDALRTAMKGYPLGFPAGFLVHQEPEKALYHDSVHLDVDGHGYYAAYLSARIREVSGRWRAFERARP